MARIRTIKPVFFRHNEMYLAEKESKLPLRLAFIGLWTVADREGRFRWKPIEIKLDIFPYDNLDFESILEALLKYGFIVKYVVNKEVLGFIPSFLKHQIPNSHEAKSTLDAYSENNNAYASTCMHVNAPLEGKGREVEGNKPTPAAKAAVKVFTAEVEACYRAYPSMRENKTSTGKSLKDKETIDKILLNGFDLLAAIEFHKRTCGGYPKNLSTFLNNLPDPSTFNDKPPIALPQGVRMMDRGPQI